MNHLPSGQFKVLRDYEIEYVDELEIRGELLTDHLRPTG